jgi:serine/threonine protein kinase
MVTRSGNAVLTDFGIAHVSHSSLRQTIAIGTVPYMSPEQIAGVAYPQTDLYSLGVTMYEACAGHLPFGNLDNREAIVKAVTSKEPFTCLERVCPQVPASYARIINRCIRKTYQERYANAAAALRDLQQCDGFNAAVQVPKVGGGFSPLAKLLNYICDAAGNFVTHARATQPALHQLQSAARLSVFYNGTLHSQYNLCNESFVIGRDAAQCNLVVMKDVISRRHAELKPRADGSWTLLDLSSNGTFFNSRCIGQGNSVVLPRNSRFRVCSTIDVEFLLE